MFCFSVPSRGPGGVRVTSFEFVSDLLVEWDPLPAYYANGKILGYIIYYIDNALFQLKSVNTSSHFPTQFTLKGLKPALGYYVAVAAFTSKGVGPLSNVEYATTGTFANYCLFVCFYVLGDSLIASCSSSMWYLRGTYL